MTISGEDLNSRPVATNTEILEAAPGLAVVQHSGSGKANQYYLRGYNLDHGTDLAIFWDDIPINLPTNAHGQGYADLNFLIPETLAGLEVRKGPYFADVGDFANAGDLHLFLRDSVPQNIVSATVGSFGYDRFLTLGSTKLGGGSLLYAGEFKPTTVRGSPAKMSASSAVFCATARARRRMGFPPPPWATPTTGTHPIRSRCAPSPPDRSVSSARSTRRTAATPAGSCCRPGLRNPTMPDCGRQMPISSKETMNLWNNFTWFTTDPMNGDQFHQHDDRIYGGAGVSRTINGTLFSRPTETLFGVQTRYDDIDVSLGNTAQRLFLANTLVDHVGEGNVGIYAQNTTRWTDWFRTTAGWRGDYFWASVNSILQQANSGNAQAAIGSPKFTMTFGPFYKTELFLGAGMGYHSNDARGVTSTQVAGDPTTPQDTAPFLVRSRGAEIGVRTKAIPNLDSSISLFYLHQGSELVFEGDTGTTSPGPPSTRTGIEITNNYRLASWMSVDADLALSRARFDGFDTAQEQLFQSLAGFPQAQIGNAPGNFIPEAPWMVATAGVDLGEKTGWFGALRWRYISSRPLTEDGVFQSPPLTSSTAEVGYRFANGWRVQVDALNLLNSTTYNASYAYGALLTTDALFAMCFPTPKIPVAVCQNGFMDYSIHPHGAHGLSADARRTARYDRCLRNGGRVRAGNSGLHTAIAKLRLDRFLRRRLRRIQLGEHQRQRRQPCNGRRSASDQRQPAELARRPAVGFRLHDAVAPAPWRCRGRDLRRHEDNYGHRRFRHQRQPDHGIRQRDRTRAHWLRVRHRAPLRNGGMGVVEQSIRPHPAYWHAQQRHCGRGRGGEPVFQRVDGGRRRLRRCRAELERVRRVSLHGFWNHGVHAAAVAAIDDVDNEGQRHRIRRQLHVQRQGTICSRFRGG